MLVIRMCAIGFASAFSDVRFTEGTLAEPVAYEDEARIMQWSLLVEIS
jgi:hypothetical protein